MIKPYRLNGCKKFAYEMLGFHLLLAAQMEKTSVNPIKEIRVKRIQLPSIFHEINFSEHYCIVILQAK